MQTASESGLREKKRIEFMRQKRFSLSDRKRQ